MRAGGNDCGRGEDYRQRLTLPSAVGLALRVNLAEAGAFQAVMERTIGLLEVAEAHRNVDRVGQGECCPLFYLTDFQLSDPRPLTHCFEKPSRGTSCPPRR